MTVAVGLAPVIHVRRAEPLTFLLCIWKYPVRIRANRQGMKYMCLVQLSPFGR